MSEPPANSYDDLPYEDLVFGYTQPASLATVGTLHGLEPPPLDRCRVLDIGCASGCNLVPMALTSPGGEFVGLDLSPAQIARGREMLTRLGLTNVTLQARNLLDSTDDLGMFDYIVCHGVYSWVPPPVQDRILDVIRRHLAPTGIAYVSYNTYPGWHLRGMVRDVVMFHAAGVEGGPAVQAAQARAFLEVMADALSDQDTSYGTIVQREAERLRPVSDTYLFHEYLETDNRPVYFHQFAAHAAAHELQYLAEATPQPLPGKLKAGVLENLAAIAGDRLRLEQCLDFVRCRIFRRSLLVHAAVRPQWDGARDRIPAFAVSSRAKPEANAPDADPAKRETFVVSDHVRFATADPVLRAVMWRLWQARPAAVSFADLLAAARAAADGDITRDLADGLLQLYLGDSIELHLQPPSVTAAAGPRPAASPFARFQTERGDLKIFSLNHRTENPDPFARFLLPFLDGTRTRPELVNLLAARAAANEFAVNDNAGQPVTDPAVVRPVLTAWLDSALDRLASAALLTA